MIRIEEPFEYDRFCYNCGDITNTRVTKVTIIQLQEPVKLQYEQLLEDIESISEPYVFNHDIYVRKDEVLDIINNLRK